MTEYNRTTMSVETADSIDIRELRAIREDNQMLRARLFELENENAKLKEINEMLVKKSRYVFVDKSENIFIPPWGR